MILLTEGATMERMFGLDWQLIADSTLTIVAVFILFAAMSYFLFNPARKMLQDRKSRIQNELAEAKNSMEAAQGLKAEYEQKIAGIEKEAELILSDARKRALDNENQIIAGARDEAARIMERARIEAQLEKQKMMDDVKTEMIQVASMMAGKFLTASIDEGMQKQLIDETLKEMGENTWQS